MIKQNTTQAIESEDAGYTNDTIETDPLAGTYQYQSWWNQFRAPWLKSEQMSEEQIKAKTDEAWDCGDYKEMISLMAELICRLEQK